jgi:hypothetical protein
MKHVKGTHTGFLFVSEKSKSVHVVMVFPDMYVTECGMCLLIVGLMCSPHSSCSMLWVVCPMSPYFWLFLPFFGFGSPSPSFNSGILHWNLK